MTAPNNTPGPWRVVRSPEWGEVIVCGPAVDGADGWIADCGQFDCPEDRADATLISAAPDMLAALRDLRSAIGWSGDHNPFPDDPVMGRAMQAADEAIAKATGGGE